MNSIFTSRFWYVLIGYIGLIILVVVLSASLFSVLDGLAFDMYCESVVNVITSGKIVYALTIDRELNYRSYRSSNGGLTWLQVTDVPDSVENDLYSLTYKNFEPVCHPSINYLCYRISKLDKAEKFVPEFPTKLEQSTNEGKTWHEISPPFNLTSESGCKDHYPRNLTFVELEGSTGAYSLVIAVNSGTVYNGFCKLGEEYQKGRSGCTLKKRTN
jgi:hypothetical protein